ncbi:hypothetical protein C8Q74DRAFT_1216816 [Fomes fomentarius]|nr:hypothetical protein C8Q74DRAFT_1216816 [Fomes fomentarius]
MSHSTTRLPGIASFFPPPGFQSGPPGHSFYFPAAHFHKVHPRFPGPLKVPGEPNLRSDSDRPPRPPTPDPSPWSEDQIHTNHDVLPPPSILEPVPEHNQAQATETLDRLPECSSHSSGAATPVEDHPDATNHEDSVDTRADLDSSIFILCSGSGIEYPPRQPPPSQFRFTEEQRRVLEAMYSQRKFVNGTALARLAREFGVPKSSISACTTGVCEEEEAGKQTTASPTAVF